MFYKCINCPKCFLMKPLRFILILILFTNIFSARAGGNRFKPQKKITYRIHKRVIETNEKRYKQIKSCEAKFMKRFARVYARQQNKVYNADNLSSPFFSSSPGSRF